MSNQTAPLNFYYSLPKVELHRHLEGSLRVSTMLDIAYANGISLPKSKFELSKLVQIQDEDALTFQNFLSKFNTLRLFYKSPEVIKRMTREAVEDAAKDNIKYLELRFTPVALSRAENFPLKDVIDWVCSSAADAAKDFEIKVRLLASVNRHESPELAEQVARLAAENIERGIVGMDLAGNEVEFSAIPFKGIFKEAKQAGLQITIHAGEWAGAENVREAIEELGAKRIGHGVRVMEDEQVVALAREHGITFEVCVTSNYQSGVVPSLDAHPIPQMMHANLNVTVDTDDPGISRIDLSHEYRMIREELGVSLESLKECNLQAARSAFLPDDEREALIMIIEKE